MSRPQPAPLIGGVAGRGHARTGHMERYQLSSVLETLAGEPLWRVSERCPVLVVVDAMRWTMIWWVFRGHPRQFMVI